MTYLWIQTTCQSYGTGAGFMEVIEDSANDNFGQRYTQLDERGLYSTVWDSRRRIPPSINIVSTEQNIQRPEQQRSKRIDSIELFRLASEVLSEIGLAVQYQIFVFADVSKAGRIADMNSVSVSRRQIVFEHIYRFRSLYGGCNDYVSVCDGLSGRDVLPRCPSLSHTSCRGTTAHRTRRTDFGRR
jgi:hypothetical protein